MHANIMIIRWGDLGEKTKREEIWVLSPPSRSVFSLFARVFHASSHCLNAHDRPRGGGGGGGVTPYNGLYWEAPPERDTFFTLQVYERVGFHESKYMKG